MAKTRKPTPADGMKAPAIMGIVDPLRMVAETPGEVRWIKVGDSGMKLQQRWRTEIFRNGILAEVQSDWREVPIIAEGVT